MEKRSWGVLKKKLDSGISCGLYRSGEYYMFTCCRGTLLFLAIFYMTYISLQCSDTVGWVTGRASGQ